MTKLEQAKALLKQAEVLIGHDFDDNGNVELEEALQYLEKAIGAVAYVEKDREYFPAKKV